MATKKAATKKTATKKKAAEKETVAKKEGPLYVRELQAMYAGILAETKPHINDDEKARATHDLIASRIEMLTPVRDCRVQELIDALRP